MKISKEAKVGILAIVTITMLYFGFNFLKGSDFFSTTHKYYVLYDNVGSLQPSNPIKLNGVAVGIVKATELLQERGNAVLVTLDINRDIILTKGTKAMLTSELLGGSALMLQIPSGAPRLNEGDTLLAETEKGIQSLLQEKALPVVKNADSLIVSLNKIINQFDQTGYALNKLLTTTDQTAMGINALVAQNRQTIAATMANINALSASLIETEKGMKPILSNLLTTTDSLKALRLGQTLAQANAAVATLQKSLTALEQGQGTAGKLLKDQALYDNLNRTIVSVNKLMTNFRQYPKRYVNVSVFSKKDKGPADSPADTTLKY
ncbi:MlaD family protein [Runella salmonicolor]|uniref:MlaD family protein n=1 Tax=Runella salmonicolor TaxID=2950278 RepID=A0ABT1FQC5_9BACT|nr:MlaD family protein [Runella salmonicolor]MCP1383891.1 MlaD family protein [Runella salmonicolor]